MNVRYPISHCKYVKKSYSDIPYKCGTSLIKLAHDVACIPALPTKLKCGTKATSSSRKLEIFQKWPKEVLRYVFKSLTSKMKKIQKGSVLSGQWQIANHYVGWWCKGKLKPPNNDQIIEALIKEIGSPCP